LSLGDSFHGFDVISTNEDYFTHYRYLSGRLLAFDKGGSLEGFFNVVLGSKVAKKLHIKVDDTVHLCNI